MDNPVLLPVPEKKTEPTLLPQVLLGPAAVLWLWVLPIGILGLLNLQGYRLVEGNLDPPQHSKALLFGLSGGANLVLGLVFYGLSLRDGRRTVTASAGHFLWGLPAVLIQVAYLWFAVSSIDQILPRSVTAWIYPTERFLFNQFAFAMLPLFTGILRIAGVRPAGGAGRAITSNLGLALAAPVLLYFVFAVFRAVQSAHQIDGVVLATVVILLGIVMFVAIVRALLLALRQTERWQANGERWAIILFALVLPLGGLLLNRDIPFPVDFQAWEVYALVVANAGILLLASYQHARRPKMSFCLLCATFPFSLYFFIVFLPYIPLSILALIAVGAGFLVLSPTLLFAVHLHLLHKARRNALLNPGRLSATLAGLLCSFLLPAFFTARGLADKAALNAALDYVYSPSVTAGNIIYPASRANLRRALGSHRSYKNGLYYPLLSDYYSWLVFDNLILPDDKLTRLERTFFGAAGTDAETDPVRHRASFWGRSSVRDRSRMPRATPASHTVEVSRLNVGTNPVAARQTTVTLALTLENTGQAAAEYLKTLQLPAGIYVTGFRLHIDGRTVPGRIFETKTALWVYTMIRDGERRDPGLLCYRAVDELELRVFPVNRAEPVVVEIDFLVPALVAAGSFSTEAKDAAAVLIMLGKNISPQIARDGRGNAYVAGLASSLLPGAEREPYLHLLVDRSKASGYTGDLSMDIRLLQEKFPAARRVRVTLVNFNVLDLVPNLTPFAEIPSLTEKDLASVLPLSGGLALDLAMAHAIRLHHDADLDQPAPADRIPTRPVFVILSGKAGSLPPELKITGAWTDILPSLEIWELGIDGLHVAQTPVAPAAAPLLRLGNSMRPLTDRYGACFRTENAGDQLKYWSPETSSWRPVENLAPQADSAAWTQAVKLQLQQQDFDRSPGEAGNNLKALVKASRPSGVLLAATSYIVVENPAQWRMLELSEHQKLDQNAALEFLEAPAPSALFPVIGFGLWLGFRCRRRLRKCYPAEAAA